MFRKKVVIFGRSVSLSLVVALVTVTAAAALWGITAYTISFYVTSGAQDSVLISTTYCDVNLDNNTSPDVTTCSVSGTNVSIENASPGDRYVSATWYTAPSTNSATLYAQPIDVDAWGSTLDLDNDLGCGLAFAPGDTAGVNVFFQFDADGHDTSPSTGYGPFPVTREFAPTVPTCP